MKYYSNKTPELLLLIFTAALLVPVDVVFAQSRTIQSMIMAVTSFLSDTLIPFLFALAILFLVINVTRYFIIDGNDVSSREAAKKYAIYAVLALVVITSIYGIVGLLRSSFGLTGDVPVCPDYIQGAGNSTGCSSPSPNSRYNNSGWGNSPFGEFGNTPLGPNSAGNNYGWGTGAGGEFDTSN